MNLGSKPRPKLVTLGFVPAVDPWTWRGHPLAWLVVIFGLSAYALLVWPGSSLPRRYTPARQIVSFLAGMICLAAATTWPLDDLAQRWSLSARMGQQILLVLAVPPLVLLGLPRSAYSALTRPPLLDALLRRLTRPLTATLVFTATVIATLSPACIAAEASSGWVQGGINLALLVAGAIMWLPALRLLPGMDHMSTGGRIAYLLVQSLLPNFPALIYIFARHPFYPVFADHVRAIGLSPIGDQELAGVLAKLVGVVVLWGAAALIWRHADRAEQAGQDPDPLTWEDVERELRRASRRQRGRSDAR